MKLLLIACLVALTLSFIGGLIVIPILRRIKVGQPILKYVEVHKDKSGTPTMGGLFFIISTAIIFLIFKGYEGRIATVILAIGLAFMLVGFLDDFLKIKFHKNEGLKAYQKIIFQLGIAVLAGVFAYVNGITVFYLPFSYEVVELDLWTIPIVALIFIAVTNSVNLTDGLDGLAGSVSVVYLLSLMVIIFVQMQKFGYLYTAEKEYDYVLLLGFCLIGGLLGFLIFNTNKACVFMGDTGSLALGGFIAGISIFTLNSFFIPVIGIMFVMSSISVIVQVLYFKRTHKRVFLMAPLHHHFQMKGYSEGRISFVYSLITLLMGVLSVVFYL